MKVLIIDNYDSFTYNLVQLFEECGSVVCVKRNDEIDPSYITSFDRLVISPGPGIPSEAGLTPLLISQYSGIIPILGICLGHQAIAEVHGGSIVNMKTVFHGVKSKVIRSEESLLLRDLPDEFSAGRYHSWIIENVPPGFVVTARDEHDLILAIENVHLKIFGLQFHPESILTEYGKQMILNFLLT